MGGMRILKSAGGAALGVGALTLATAEATGRCGGVYPADAPTTLQAVAGQCNVRVSDLREANPGVDPDHVLPGERIAIPSEIDPYANAATEIVEQAIAETNESETSSNAYAGITSSFRVDPSRAAHRIRVRDHRTSASGRASGVIWFSRESTQASRYSASAPLSFQKLAARRIHTAGLALPAAQYASAPPSSLRYADCFVKEEQQSGLPRKLDQEPWMSGASDAVAADDESYECMTIAAPAVPATPSLGYRLPDYGSIGFEVEKRTPGSTATFALVGEVVDINASCLLLQTRSGGLWRLSSGGPTQGLIGKNVTVWGAPVVGGACGAGPSMAVSHIVFAEPWAGN